MDSIQNLDITTILNPHLFWVISSNDVRTKTLDELEKFMEDDCKKVSKTALSFEIGEIVAVRVQKRLCRAVIELIQAESSRYLCWLVDYGFTIEAEAVFRLSPVIRKTPALALQASLNDVTYFEQHLDYGPDGEPMTVNIPVKSPSSNSRQVMLELLYESKSLEFKLEKKADGIIFGDISYTDKQGRDRSVRDDLIEKGILQVNKSVFEEIKESINDYKERNLKRIVNICKSNLETLIRLTKGDDVDGKCNKLVKKYLNEFDFHDALGADEDEFSPHPFSDRNRSRHNNTNSSLDLTNPSEIDSPKTTPKSSVSKKKRLLETMLLYRNAKSPETPFLSESADESNKENRTESPEISPLTSSRGKRLLEQMRKRKEGAKETSEKLVESPKTAGLRKINFYPAGSERTYFANRSKKTSPYSNGVSGNSSTQYSSEDSSGCTNFHQERKLLNNVQHRPVTTCDTRYNPKTSVNGTPSSEMQSGPTEEISTKNTTDMSETEDKSSVSTESRSLNGHGNVNMKITPHCNCKQCDSWTNEEDPMANVSFQPKVAKIVEGSRQVLFKEEDSPNDVNILSLDYSSISRIEKQSMAKVLVHSESIPNPARVISKVAFHREVHRSLVHLDYREAKRIQSYAWPALFRNQHVCMIHGPQTGKTMAYLPVMCTFVLEKFDRYESLLNVSKGPIVLVLCSSTKKCEEVYDLTKIVLGKSKARVHLITYPLGHVNASNIDLLVTTPLVLDELLKSNAVNLKRLCHVILEDGDKILNRYHGVTVKVLDLAQCVLRNRVYSKTVQLIVCAEHWTARIGGLLKRLQQVPMVCIGSHLEAALYGKVEFSMKFINSACKEFELKALLKENHKIYRSIVVCREEELEDVETIMMLKGIDSIVISEKMKKEDILYMEEVWTQAQGGQYIVLVCSDFILNTMLSVTCASLLIHYSLPSSWTRFAKRFGCLLENCKSPLDSKEVRTVSRSVVLCDETCEDEMHKFFSYLNATELESQLPDKLQRYSKDLKLVEEEEKVQKAIGLCNNLKLFGKCIEQRCTKRHLISEALDVSDHLPKNGHVKFKIVHVQDVTSFSIALLQHEDVGGTVVRNDETLDVTEDLSATLRISRKKIHNPIVGHRYAFYDVDEQEGVYYRCELMEIDNDCVKIKLLDRGTVISSVNTRLYRLPAEFDDANKPRAVIDAYLANCIPPFEDENFSAKSFYNLKNLLETHIYKNIVFTADVHLQLSNALWLKNVCEEVILSDRIIAGFQLSREVLQKNLAILNNNQLHRLYKLCFDVNIALPTYEKKRVAAVEVAEKVTPQWAFLDAEHPEEVVFAAAVSPDEIYVRLNKYSNLLYNMQKDLQKVIKKPHYPQLKEVKIGGVYLAKDPVDLEYARVQVLNKEDDKALCFFVDFGDELVMPASELKFLQNEHITRLPFQCIQCSLHGVRPISKEWSEDVTNALYGYANEPQTDIFRSLYVKVCAKGVARVEGQRKYSVLLKDGFGERKTLINRLFVDSGLAVPDEEVIEDFEIPVSQYGDSIDSDEEEFVEMPKEDADGNFDEFELFFDEDDEEAESKFFSEVFNRPRAEPTRPSTFHRELPSISAAPPTDYHTPPTDYHTPPTDYHTPPTDYHTPDVYWTQTESVVRLAVKLTDVTDYKLKLTKSRILNFRTDKNGKTYSLKLVLYETVDSMQHTSPGPEIRITLSKAKPIDWPRLILAKQRQRNIHYDLTKMKIGDERKKKILELPDELMDEDSDDEVIDMMYHVASDLESDMDMELEQDSD